MMRTAFCSFLKVIKSFRQTLLLIGFAVMFSSLGNPFLSTHAAADDIDNFTCSGGTPNGNLFSADLLTTTLQDQQGNNVSITVNGSCGAALGIFGRVQCYFKSTLGQIMSAMYCSFQAAIVPALGAAITLFIVIFGILIITGMVRFTVKEAGLALFKIALVWVFATNASYGIGYGYKFFLEGAEEGAQIVSNALSTASPQCNGTTPAGTSPLSPAGTDQTNTTLLTNASTAGGQTNGTDVITLPFKGANCQDITISKYCASWLAGGMGLMVFFLPIASLFAGNIVLQYFLLYVRALLGYLMALVIISFLFILSPLFISFALFKVTNKLFQAWLKHLISFSLQIIVIFAFLAMIQLVLTPLTTFFGQVLPLIKEYDIGVSKTSIAYSSRGCSFCQYEISNNTASGSSAPSTGLLSSWQSPSSIKCAASSTSGDSTSSTGASGSGADAYVPAINGGGNVIPLTNLLQHSDLIMFMISNALALWLIASVLQDFLKKAPELARQIGGLPFAASLMGEAGPTADIGGVKFAGLKGIEDAAQSVAGSVLGSDNKIIRAGLGAGVAGWLMSGGSASAQTTPRRAPDTSPPPAPGKDPNNP